MKQKIIIKNFGPIKEVEMEIDDFTIFIGPQTSGKSTIAKSVFFFLSLRDDLLGIISKNINSNDYGDYLKEFKKFIFMKFYPYWGINDPDMNFQIQYFYTENCSILLEKNINFFRLSEDLESQILSLINSVKTKASLMNVDKDKFLTSKDLVIKESERQNILNDLQNSINNIFGFDEDILFIPAGRSILALLANQMQDISIKKLDYLMRMFIERINSLKNVIIDSDDYGIDFFIKGGALDQESLDFMKNLSKSILNGSYVNDEEEGDKIKISDSQYIKLLLASSGQQESVWIIQIVLLLILNKQKVFIVIEEPEAHLFPKTQKDILNLIVLLSNTSDNKIFITTHSPYILTSLNNNIYAYQVGQQYEEKVDKIIDKRLWMNPDKVQAYFVGGENNKGCIRDIIDPDLKIIKAEEIDSVSRINNHEFDQLFDL
jgi:predicted ATP-dependent endonuclease of OLD family